MDATKLMSTLLVIVFVAFVVLSLLWSEIRSWLIRRRHRRMAPTPIAALPEHRVCRIVGRVAASKQTLTAPLTGRPCVFYTLTISEQFARGSSVRATDRRGARFAVSDHSATAVVDPLHSRIALKVDHSQESNAVDGPTLEQAALLTRYGLHGLQTKRWFLHRKYLFEEAVIAVGDTIGVIGTAVRERDVPEPVSAHCTELPSIRMRFTGSEQAPLVILCGPQP
jgi:hypothetical protein